jgi:hypothetical protein
MGCGISNSGPKLDPISQFTASFQGETVASKSQVVFNWTDISGEDRYIVSVSNSSNGPFTEIVTTGANVTTATASLGSGTYYFQLIAKVKVTVESPPTTAGPLQIP